MFLVLGKVSISVGCRLEKVVKTANDLMQKWNNLNLIEAEKSVVLVETLEEDTVIRRGKLCLVGLLVSEKVVNEEVFQNNMTKVWKPVGELQFQHVGTNLFLIEFSNQADMEMVRLGWPWTFFFTVVLYA